MEVVEDASTALVKSCNELLDFLPQPQDEVQFRDAMVKASDALFKAKRFSSVLSSSRGHAKFRRSSKPETSIPQSILLESFFLETDNHTSFRGSPTKSILNSSSSHENHTQNLLESSSLNHSSASLLQPTKFHQNLNAELGLSSKSLMCLEFGLKGESQPNISHQNLNAEPGSSSRSSVCLDLSSNGKSHRSIYNQNLIAEPGLSCKSSVFLDLSSNGKPPIHRSHQAPTPFQFHQHLQQQKLQYQQYEQHQMKHRAEKLLHSRANLNFDSSCYDPIVSSSRSLMSSLSIDGSVTNLSRNSFHYMADPRSVAQNSQHLKRKCPGNGGNGSVHCGSNGPSGSRCHCAKKRKNKFRKSIIVPAISNKMADIPPDEYSWRKYGQKPIKNADHPRGYYKCSGNKGCPAKKRVERCTDEPTQLRITYENDHNHPVGQGLLHNTHSS